MTKQKLRWLIAIEIGLFLVSVKIGWFGLDQIGLDEPLKDWLLSEEERDFSQQEWVLLIADLAMIPVIIFSWIWLWMLKPYSRILYTVTVLLGFVFYPLGGAYVSNGWIEIFDGFTSVITGMILCALYFTDVYPNKQTTQNKMQ